MKEKNFELWASLTKPYAKAVDNICRLANNFDIVIVTSNERKTVGFTLKKEKIAIREEDIIDINISRDKIKQLEFVKGKYKVNFDEIIFVDDQVAQLLAAKKLGVRLFLAGWGFSNKEQKLKAKENSIEILNEDNFYDKIAELR